MGVVLTTNIDQVINGIRRMAADIKPEYKVLVINTKRYAAAVDRGWTKTVFWRDLSPRQRFTIIMSAKARDAGKEPEDDKDKSTPSGTTTTAKGGTVERFTDPKGFKIVMPPVGMIAKSLPDIEAFAKNSLKRHLRGAISDRKMDVATLDIGMFALTVLVGNTPVDQGELIKGWELKKL